MSKSLILIIEDDVEINDMLTEVAKMHDYSVIQARDGREAIDLISQNNIIPELVLCDINMPMMNGIEFIKHTIIQNMDLNICLMTGSNDSADIVEALQLGAVDYISKPFKIDVLIEKIELLVDIGRRKKLIKEQLLGNPFINNSLKMNNLLKIKNSQK